MSIKQSVDKAGSLPLYLEVPPIRFAWWSPLPCGAGPRVPGDAGIFILRGNVLRNKSRVSCFIDGFNLYHAIDALNKDYLKWVDYFGLASAFIMPSKEELAAVYYFSALPEWDPPKRERHEAFNDAIQAKGVQSIIGKFKKKRQRCPHCHETWNGHEEKETDVQIALYMMKSVLQKECDKILLVSADSDFVPAVKMIKGISPDFPVVLLTPPGRSKRALDLRLAADRFATIKPKHLERNLLPEKLAHQGRTILRPDGYAPPASSARG